MLNQLYDENRQLERERLRLERERDVLTRRLSNATLERKLVLGGLGKLAKTAASMAMASPPETESRRPTYGKASGGPAPGGELTPETLRSWAGEFGAENAVAWLAGRKSLSEARVAHNEQLQAAVAGLTTQLESLRAQIASAA